MLALPQCKHYLPASGLGRLLLGGDNRGDWTGWYERNIPIADDLYDEHLRNLDDEEG